MTKPIKVIPATTKELINSLQNSIDGIEDREKKGVSFEFDMEDKIKMYKEIERLKKL